MPTHFISFSTLSKKKDASVMDNCSTCKAKETGMLIVNRAYWSLFLPYYYPELNPIELSWANAKNKIDCSKFGAVMNLKRIRESCNKVSIRCLKAFHL